MIKCLAKKHDDSALFFHILIKWQIYELDNHTSESTVKQVRLSLRHYRRVGGWVGPFRCHPVGSNDAC